MFYENFGLIGFCVTRLINVIQNDTMLQNTIGAFLIKDTEDLEKIRKSNYYNKNKIF